MESYKFYDFKTSLKKVIFMRLPRRLAMTLLSYEIATQARNDTFFQIKIKMKD